MLSLGGCCRDGAQGMAPAAPRPRSMVLAFALPVFLLLFFGYAISWDVRDLGWPCWTRTARRASRALVEAFEASGYFSVVGHARARRRWSAYLLPARAAVLVIPPGLRARPRQPAAARRSSCCSTAATRTRRPSRSTTPTPSRPLLARRRAARPARVEPPAVAETRVWYNPTLESRNMIVPGLIAVIMSIIAAMLTALTIAREWERGTMEQLAATPVHRLEVVFGKLLPYLGIGLFDVAVITAMAGMLIFGVPLRGSVLLLGAMTVLFLLGALGLGMFISAVLGRRCWPRRSPWSSRTCRHCCCPASCSTSQHAGGAARNHVHRAGQVLHCGDARRVPEGRRPRGAVGAGLSMVLFATVGIGLATPRSASGSRHERTPGRRLQRVAALVRKELRQIFRDPKTKRIVFASPILQLLLFGYAVTTDVHNVATFVVDHDHTAESRALQDALTGGYFRVVGRSDRPGDLARALDRGAPWSARDPGRLRARPGGGPRAAPCRCWWMARARTRAPWRRATPRASSRSSGSRHAAARGVQLDGGVDLRTRAWFNPALESRPTTCRPSSACCCC
jgi:hypothetical protein